MAAKPETSCGRGRVSHIPWAGRMRFQCWQPLPAPTAVEGREQVSGAAGALLRFVSARSAQETTPTAPHPLKSHVRPRKIVLQNYRIFQTESIHLLLCFNCESLESPVQAGLFGYESLLITQCSSMTSDREASRTTAKAAASAVKLPERAAPGRHHRQTLSMLFTEGHPRLWPSGPLLFFHFHSTVSHQSDRCETMDLNYCLLTA